MTERPREPRLITSEADILAELESLVALDDRLAMVVESAGSVPLRLRPGGLKGLCAIVTAQQVSKASADAIFGRLSDQADLDDALAVRALGDDAFRAAGVSRPKQRTILGLAEAAADGRLDFDRLSRASGPDAVAELVALKGIGIWTAQCYLLFCVGHRDVFPGGDLALQAALAHAFAQGSGSDRRGLGTASLGGRSSLLVLLCRDRTPGRGAALTHSQQPPPFARRQRKADRTVPSTAIHGLIHNIFTAPRALVRHHDSSSGTGRTPHRRRARLHKGDMLEHDNAYGT